MIQIFSTAQFSQKHKGMTKFIRVFRELGMYNFENPGLSFVGEKAVEGVDVIAGHVMGTKAAEETSMAVKTLHRALISPNETSSRFFPNHDVISPHEEASSEPKAWNVSDISPLSYPVLGMAEAWE